MNLSRFLNKNPVLIFTVLIVTFSLGLIYFASPLVRELGDLRASYREENLKVRRISGEIAVTDKIKAKSIPYLEHIPQALDELTRSANKSGISFDSIKQKEPEGLSKNYQILPLFIESTCDFQALADFLGGLEDLEKSIIVVKRLEITREEDILPDLKVSLDLGMYLASD